MKVDALLERCCVEVGVTASGASVSTAPIQFYRKYEGLALEEQLALIRDPSLDNALLLGVIRNVTKFEPLIRDRVRTPFIDRPEILDQSILMPFTSAVIKLYATLDLVKGSFKEVRHVPTPGSRVYIVKDGGFLGSFIKVERPIIIGSHKYSGWAIPLDANYVNHHVGVFGATGVGKSRLVKALIEELVRVGKKVIVFDHSGLDYAPFFRDRALSSKEIAISPPAIASVIAEKARLSWQTFGEYLEIAVITYASGKEIRKGGGALITKQRQANKWDKQSFLQHLANTMRSLNARDSTIEKARLFIDYFIDDLFFEELNKRAIKPEHIVERALEEGLIVIDLSADTEIEVKQAIIADVMDSAWRIAKASKTPLDLVFVIDEAQNYVPEGEWTICGNVIETTAREGRKWGLSIILASQRIARDIRTSVRANLGTVFFSRLSAQGDLREIAAYMDLADINEASLAQLSTRDFYVAGLMNPLRKPILIHVRNA